ncbi:MAG: recombination protein RecR [Bacteroidetes bacterium]|nr:recombination protein RecR [Bacteroidota bacterium]
MFYQRTFPSKLVEDAVNEFSKLPGIGKRTALRLVLHLLRQEETQSKHLGNALIKMRSEILFCDSCHNISDSETCFICSDGSRDHSTICVVEDVRDMLAIEQTNQYRGIYHILGGVISPMNAIGPKDLNIDTLIEKVNSGSVKEIIMALRTTMEGDTTNFYIYKKISESNVVISTIARGVAIGDELEYTDEITLGRSIINRTLYEKTI